MKLLWNFIQANSICFLILFLYKHWDLADQDLRATLGMESLLITGMLVVATVLLTDWAKRHKGEGESE